jgi:hypothetical protein
MADRADIQADAVTLLDLLEGDREYHAPLFQRPFVWEAAQINRLWSDIRALLEGEERIRFLGAIVLEERHKIQPTDPRSYWIIDGQQRLTTLYLLLCALCVLASSSGDMELSENIRTRLFNQHGRRRDEPKIRPTVPDLTQFNRILRSIPDATPKLLPDQGNKVGKLSEGL